MVKHFRNRLGTLLLCGCMLLQGMPLQAGAAELLDIQTAELQSAEFQSAELQTADPEEVVWEEADGSLYQEGALRVETLSGAETLCFFGTDAADGTAEIQQYLYQQLVDRVESIDVSGYGIAKSDIYALYSGVINEHPELYYVYGGISYSYNPATEYVVTVKVTYLSGFDDAAFVRAARRALSGIDSSMSDMEKAIVLHDYLAVNCQYDTEFTNTNSHSAYGVLVDQVAVCQGYALAYKYLLNQAGVECLMVTSTELNHAWNMVKLDGEYYQADVTWDDPVNDRLGRARHFYMFVSDDAFRDDRKHDASDWQIVKDGYTAEVTAANTVYDDYFWKNVDAPFVLDGGSCYYLNSSGALVRGDLEGNVSGTLKDSLDRWQVWQGSGYWPGSFSGLFELGDQLYYNKTDGIYRIDKDGTNEEQVYAADITDGYVYGSAYVYNCAENRNQVNYVIGTSANFSGDEPIYEATLADTEIPEPDPVAAPATPIFAVNGAYQTVDGGVLVDAGTTVTIQSEIGASVYYTTDGSVPAYGGCLYTAPMEINENVTVRAVAYRDGLTSDEAAENYLAADNRLELSESAIVLQEGAERKLQVSVLPTTRTTADLSWSSSDETVAAVTSDGTVNAVAEGSATITATVLDWQGRTVTASCTVEVAAPQYTVTFVGFGGEIIKTETVKEGQGATAPEPPKAGGYQFTGWSGNYTAVTKDETVTAQYTPILYTITYVLAGGVNGENPDSYTIESENIPLQDAFGRDGYVFVGWYDNAVYSGDSIKEIRQGSVGNITLYARWRNEKELWMQWDGTEEGEDLIAAYTGKAVKPAFTVYYGDTALQAGKDYTVTYKNNVNAWQAEPEEGQMTDGDWAKAPTVLIKGKGNYKGTVSATFQITPKSLEAEDVTAETIAVAYNKKIQKKVPTVRWGTKKLANKKDFMVSYPDETGEDQGVYQGVYQEPGEYRILVTGMGNYCGQIEVPMTIVKTDAKDEAAPRLMSKAKVSAVPAQEYTGEAICLETLGLPVVKYGKEQLVEGEDYELIYGEDCIQIGTYPLIVRGIGQYVGEIHTTFKIKGLSINTVKVAGIVNRVYDGAQQTQELTVTDQSGAPLTENVDYAVEYENNVEAGTAKIVITGMGKYSGTLKKTFKITALSLEDIPAEDLEIQFAQGTADAQPYEKGGAKPKLVIRYHYTDEQGERQSMVLQEGVHYSLSYKNNTTMSPKEGKEPYILVNGKKNFAKSVKVDFGIAKADLSTVTVAAADVQENAKPGKFYSVPVLTDANGKKLVKGTDYEATFLYTDQNGVVLAKEARPAAGDVITVTVTGKGNYTGTGQTTYRIYAKGKSIASAKVKVLRPIYYTGEPATLAQSDLEVKLGTTVLDADDYEIVSYSYVNNTKKGTAKVTIAGKGEYAGKKTISFKIQAQNLNWWEKVKEALIGSW